MLIFFEKERKIKKPDSKQKIWLWRRVMKSNRIIAV